MTAPFSVTAPPPPRSSNYQLPNNNSNLTYFNRGIKRDPNVFQLFNSKRGWIYWKDHTMTIINSQHVEDITTLSCVPIENTVTDLFSAIQTYVFHICITNPNTGTGEN